MTDYQFNPNQEQWKDISGFPGYEVSDHGRVRVFWKRVCNGIGKGCHMVLSDTPQRYFSTYVGSSGYVQVRLHRDGRGYNKRVHQMVLEAFVGPCPPGLEACHEDGNRLRNRLDNLRWDTCKNNLHDMKKHGTAPIGIKHGRSKLTEDDVIKIRWLHNSWNCSKSDIAKEFKVSRRNISLIVTRKTWIHIP